MSQAVFRDAVPSGTQVRSIVLGQAVAQGGEGIIYEARHPSHGKVLVKEFWPKQIVSRARSRRVQASMAKWQDEYRRAVDRFIDLGERFQQLEYPGLMRVHEVMVENNTAYLVMERVPGRSLEQALEDGAMRDPDEVERLARQLADTLEFLHRHNLLHRDVAPDNIIITPGRDWRAVLIDCSAAKDIIRRVSQSTEGVVKPGYTPPEQADQTVTAGVGPWSDIYAASAVLYRCVAGEPAPSSTTRLLREDFVSLTQRFAGRFDEALLAGIDAGLNLRPEKRPQDVAQWRERMGFTGGPLPPEPELDAEPAPEPEPLPTPAAPKSRPVPRPAQAAKKSAGKSSEPEKIGAGKADPVHEPEPEPEADPPKEKLSQKLLLLLSSARSPAELALAAFGLFAALILAALLITLWKYGDTQQPGGTDHEAIVERHSTQFTALAEGRERLASGLWFQREGEGSKADAVRKDDLLDLTIAYTTLDGKIINGEYASGTVTRADFPLGGEAFDLLSYGGKASFLIDLAEVSRADPALADRLGSKSGINLGEAKEAIATVTVRKCVDPGIGEGDGTVRRPCLEGVWSVTFKGRSSYGGTWTVGAENSGEMRVSFLSAAGISTEAAQTCTAWFGKDVNIECRDVRVISGGGYDPDFFTLRWSAPNLLTGNGHGTSDVYSTATFRKQD